MIALIQHVLADEARPLGMGLVVADMDTKEMLELDGPSESELKGGLPTLTLRTLLNAIDLLEQPIEDRGVIIVTNSEYIVDGFNKWKPGWKRRGWMTSQGTQVKNLDQWKKLDRMEREGRLVKICREDPRLVDAIEMAVQCAHLASGTTLPVPEPQTFVIPERPAEISPAAAASYGAW